MFERNWAAVFGGVVLACCAALAMDNSSVRGDDASATKGAKLAMEKGKADADKAKSRNRLPPYYSKVVDKEQRAAIYKIQEKYETEIDELEKQLETTEDKRDTEIIGVLTDEQRQKLASLIAESKAKTAEAKKKSAAAPAGTTASAPGSK